MAKLPYEMKTQERQAKIEQIKRLQRVFSKNLALGRAARQAEEPEPFLNLSAMEKLVFLEICELAKDALKGFQLEIFANNIQTKDENETVCSRCTGNLSVQ
jgi:hypothetical protein